MPPEVSTEELRARVLRSGVLDTRTRAADASVAAERDVDADHHRGLLEWVSRTVGHEHSLPVSVVVTLPTTRHVGGRDEMVDTLPHLYMDNYMSWVASEWQRCLPRATVVAARDRDLVSTVSLVVVLTVACERDVHVVMQR